MAYLNDIIGLLSLRDRYGLEKGQLDLGREQLAQRAKEFQDSLGLSEREAMRAAQQWQETFQETQQQREFERQQQEQLRQRQQAQQNFQNIWQMRPGEQDILTNLLSRAREQAQARTLFAPSTTVSLPRQL
jgi:hypothetical protein